MIEMLIVIVVIGLLVTVVLPNVVAIRRRSQDEKRAAQIGVVENALHEYRRLCKVYPKHTSSLKIDLDAENGLPGINNGECVAVAKFSDLLPRSFDIDWELTRYFALERGGGPSFVPTGRCTSFHLGIMMTGTDSVPLRRMSTRGWVWADDSKTVFDWRVCGTSDSPTDFDLNMYDVIAPTPY